MKTGKWPDTEIDHINGNRADNRFENLRQVSHQENGKNTKRYASNRSGFAGVGRTTNPSKWRARIRVNGKLVHLGVFDSAEDARTARKAAEKQFGFHENHGRMSR
jgi:hypothetical protein